MKKRITPPEIKKLKKGEYIVFGSNSKGDHAGGLAAYCKKHFKAKQGTARGLTGQCYAIDTMSGLKVIKEQIEPFLTTAKVMNEKIFYVTLIGCGIAGYTPEQIAPLFKDALEIENIYLPKEFYDILRPIVRGYKIFNSDFTCRAHKYEVGKEYKHKGELKICNSGLHFCLKASHCFSYYAFDKRNIVCEVEALGDVVYHTEDSKAATNHIKILRQLTWEEVLQVANEGSDNTGHSNTGYSNTGYWNTGDRNTGYSNTGYSNTGYSNTGYSNTGYSNTGNWNTGYSNTGNRNTGNWNTGYSNTGNRNTGDWNTGDWNTGDWNTGYSNTGNRNTGNRNTGNWNTGNWNTGYSNTGNWNTGNRNTGYSNTGNRNTGAFCTGEKYMTFFNKPSKMTEEDFKKSTAYSLLCQVDTKMWIQESVMTDQEKEENKGWKINEGYYKSISFAEAFKTKWDNWSENNREAFKSLPNFDKEIFELITSVKI